MRKNHYPEVIELLCSKKIDSQKFVEETAKHYPATFLKIAKIMLDVPSSANIINWRGTKINRDSVWHKNVMTLVDVGQYINAIKEIRINTDMCLKDAKEYMDMLKK